MYHSLGIILWFVSHKPQRLPLMFTTNTCIVQDFFVYLSHNAFRYNQASTHTLLVLNTCHLQHYTVMSTRSYYSSPLSSHHDNYTLLVDYSSLQSCHSHYCILVCCTRLQPILHGTCTLVLFHLHTLLLLCYSSFHNFSQYSSVQDSDILADIASFLSSCHMCSDLLEECIVWNSHCHRRSKNSSTCTQVSTVLCYMFQQHVLLMS